MSLWEEMLSKLEQAIEYIEQISKKFEFLFLMLEKIQLKQKEYP